MIITKNNDLRFTFTSNVLLILTDSKIISKISGFHNVRVAK